MDSNRGSGTVESSLTALYPCAKLGLSDRMEAWGMVGLGTGELTIEESGGTPPSRPNLGMTMGAVGARGRLLSAGEGGGLGLAIRSDAVSNAEGNLAAAQAHVSRLRLIAEGSRTLALANERTITPRGEVGVRHDLGDAETGTGLEAELGYGVGAPHGPGLVTPYAGLTLSGGAHRAPLEHQRKTAMLSEHLTRTSARAETSRVRKTPSKTPFTRALRTLALLTLSGLALLAGTKTAHAQNQPSETEVWSATLTAGSTTIIGFQSYGWNDSGDYSGGALSDQSFSFAGDTYDIRAVYLVAGFLYLVFDETNPGDITTRATRNKLTLHVASDSYSLGDASISISRSLSWNVGTSLDWSMVSSVALRITTPPPLGISGIELTSSPDAHNTYGIGDIIQATVTFNAAVDITGTPQLELALGSGKQASCASGTNTTTMVCSYTVVENDNTSVGLRIGANKLTLNGGTIRQTGSTTVDAILTHDEVGPDAGDKIDGIRPTLIATGANSPETSADGTEIHITFSESIKPVTSLTGFTVAVNGTTATIDSIAHPSGLIGQLALTLDSADTIAAGETVTLALAADAVDDQVGNGNAALAATSVTNNVPTVPHAPTSLTATAAPDPTPPLAFDLSWTAPASDGGSAITKHQYRHKTGSGAFGSWTDIANSAAGGDNATSYTVKGLTASNPPTTFTFEVRAVNANDESTASNQASATVDVPASVFPTVTPGAGEVRVEWTTPANNGSAVLKYQAWVFDDTNQIEITAYADIPGSDANTTSHTVTGLVNGIAHVVAIRAVNSVGHSAASLPDAVTPVTVPTAPTNLEATPGDGSVRLRWQAPASDGGNTITGYEYRQRTGTGSFGSWMNIVGADENTTEHTVTRLTNATAYTFEVQARNAEGDSGPSNQASAIPAAVPSAPRSLTATAGNAEVRLQWLAPASNGGSAILRYQYRQRYGSQAYGNWTDIADSAPGAANANSYTVTGLLGNAQYRFEVRAVNTGGPGAESNEVVETPAPVTRPEQLRAPQKAWMARFDRTVATQVVDAIGDRFSGGGTRGVTVGGQSLNRSGGAVDDALARDRLHGEPGAEPKGLSMDGRELLLGSSFSVGGGGKDGAPSWGAWGRFATGGFEADADGMRVEGDVTTGLLGADASRGRWLAGVAVSLSRGEGPFRLTSAMESNRRSGTVESSLTALYPYAKLGLSDRMEAWGLVGLGTGELTVRESGGTPIETDLGMTMGAVGARGRLLSAGEGGGLDLALRSDAMWVRMKSDAVSGGEGNLAAAQALVSRLRLIVEGSRTFAMADERTITPRGEIGVRHDLGDAETGTGLEAGAGVKFAGDGFSIEGAVRALVAHEDAHYREWGASGAIRVDPGTAGRGLSLSIAPTWGNAASAAARLWSAPDAAGLAPDRTFEPGSRLEAELGYGVGAPHGPGLVTPYAGLTLSGDAHRAVRTGVRWNASPSATVSLEASREAQGSGEAPANALTLRAQARW